MYKAMLLLNHNSQRHNSHALRSQVVDEWQLAYSNKLHLGKKKRFPHLYNPEIHNFFCFIKVTCHKDLQNILSRGYPPSLMPLEEDQVFWLSFLFIYFGEHISGQFNSSVSQGLTPWCSPYWMFGWNMDSSLILFRGLCDLGWLPESSPSSRDSHRKTGKEMRTHAQSWEHSLSPRPHGDTTGGFSHTTHEHPPRPLQQVSAGHTSLPI